MKYRDGTRRALASKERYNMEKQEAKSHLRMVLNSIGFADWLVIYMVARNIDRWQILPLQWHCTTYDGIF